MGHRIQSYGSDWHLGQDPKVILFENQEPEPAECGES